MSAALSRRQAIALFGALALPRHAVTGGWAAAPGRAPEAEPPPDLANLHSVVDWIRRENPPRLSFLDARWKSLEPWKAEARPVYQHHLRYEPRAVPLGATILGREDRDGFTIETVKISATDAYEIPARVLIPMRRKGRVPGVIALHCHSGQYVWGHEKILSTPGDSAALTAFRADTYGRPYSETLAQRGYAVVVIDAFYFGARRLQVETLDPATAPRETRDTLRQLAALPQGAPEWLRAVNSVCGGYETLTAKSLFAAGTTWPGLLTWDDRRSVDYLCSRPEVDADRIGCVGLSIGGLRAARLVGSDPRIKAACVVGWMVEFGRLLRNHIRHHTWMAYVPGLHASLDLPDVAALLAPGALLVQQCRRDNLYSVPTMESAIAKLQSIYAKAGIPERFRGVFYDEPHSFRPRAQDDALAWLDRWL